MEWVALVIALAAAAGTIWQAVEVRKSRADASRSNTIAAEALALARSNEDRLARAEQRAAVRFVLEIDDNEGETGWYMLRNVGTQTANAVSVDATSVTNVETRNLPYSVALEPEAGSAFRMYCSEPVYMPDTITVTWGDEEERGSQAVRVPKRREQTAE